VVVLHGDRASGFRGSGAWGGGSGARARSGSEPQPLGEELPPELLREMGIGEEGGGGVGTTGGGGSGRGKSGLPRATLALRGSWVLRVPSDFGEIGLVAEVNRILGPTLRA